MENLSIHENISDINSVKTLEKKSKRHQIFMELVETETNYVHYLDSIMMIFDLLKIYTERREELLNNIELKTIFGNFPSIYNVHKQLLGTLRSSAVNWIEETSIGKIFLKYESDLIKAYSPYVNFYETTKQMLEKCDQNKPRFHTFLKNPDIISKCGRQSLKELLIKPIQRLPSINLLLADILKHTDKSNPDYTALETSINCVTNIISYLNENKRKMERQLAMFDIFNEIDNCPSDLVSSRRSFINKCNVIEVTEDLEKPKDQLILFLLTDILEICERKSDLQVRKCKKVGQKPYKHLKLISLNAVRKVVDIPKGDEKHKDTFGLVVRSTQELKENFFSFIIMEEKYIRNKALYLQSLCRQVAFTRSIADSDTLLIRQRIYFEDNTIASGTCKKPVMRFFSRRCKRRASIRKYNAHKGVHHGPKNNWSVLPRGVKPKGQGD